MPQIPGVNKPSQTSDGAGGQRLKLIGGIAAAALVVGLAVLWWVKSAPRAAVQSSIPAEATVDSAVPEVPVQGFGPDRKTGRHGCGHRRGAFQTLGFEKNSCS